MATEHVVLVDHEDRELGRMEKMQAHTEGVLHRAFSVFLLNSSAEMLLQQRAKEKYHSGGMWSNACCSHPRPGEPVADAARRRVLEELGIEADVTPSFAFIYKTYLAGGLVEHEYDHVVFGRSDAEPAPDPAEVMATRWISMDELTRELAANSDRYTIWFRIAMSRPEMAAALHKMLV